jgi:hypothetical protein
MMRAAGTTQEAATPGSGNTIVSEMDEKWDWMTGVPTCVRYLAKSWRPIKRGPGGIVTEPPGSNRARSSLAGEVPDFSATVNMLERNS